MRGWNTQHQEFTPAFGDPTTIKQLISEFKINDIVSFDEANRLITTTIKHDQHIRLSDLITLNVFMQSKQITNKVIAFTAAQYAEVIHQLHDLSENLKRTQIQHGNLKMDNILLDFTKCQSKLDNQPQEIKFELRLINFAQFNNIKVEDNYTMIELIIIKILELSPESNNYLNFKNCYENHSCQQQNNYYLKIPSLNPLEYFRKPSWDSNVLYQFESKYREEPPLFQNFNEINQQIQQLHQYHLIVNHYQQIYNVSYIKSFYQNIVPYSSEPSNLVQACQLIDQIFYITSIISSDQQYKLAKLVEKYQFDQTIQSYQKNIQQELIMYLKSQGYFENINNFIEIIKNIDLVESFSQNLFYKEIIKKSNRDLYSLKLPNEIYVQFTKSSMILTDLVQVNIFKWQIQNFNNPIEVYTEQINKYLIDQLIYFKQIGKKYSKPLIDFCIKSKLEKSLKGTKNLNAFDNLTDFMVEGWLRWIDQYIFDIKIIKLEQLDKINKDQYIQFVQQQGFLLLKWGVENNIVNLVDGIFQQLKN